MKIGNSVQIEQECKVKGGKWWKLRMGREDTGQIVQMLSNVNEARVLSS